MTTTAGPTFFVACDSTAQHPLPQQSRRQPSPTVAITAGAAFNEDGRAQAGHGLNHRRLQRRRQARYLQDEFLRRHRDPLSQQRKRHFRRPSPIPPVSGSTPNTSAGAPCSSISITMDGPIFCSSTATSTRKVDSQHLGSTFSGTTHPLSQQWQRLRSPTFPPMPARAIITINSSRGLAIGDLWNDGHLSAVISNMNAPPSLPGQRCSQFQSLDCLSPYRHLLCGSLANTSHESRRPLAARITMKAGPPPFSSTKSAAARATIRNSDMRVHFGLGSATKLDSVQNPLARAALVESFDKPRGRQDSFH